MTPGSDSPLAWSQVDSDRFGLRIHRASMARVDERQLFDAIVANETDIAIVRLPAGSGARLQRLGRRGMHPIHADTLVVYEARLDASPPQALRNGDLEFSIAGPGDAAQLDALVASTFSGYVSHYHANPLLDPALILAGYAEWASGYLAGTGDDRTAWVARRNGAIVAFACCRHDVSTGECEGVLYGVHPDHAGGGLYGDLIRYTKAYYQDRGFRVMKVSTQVWNIAVQKVWSREGFVLTQAFDTFHVNAMLSSGHELVRREILFTPAQVQEFARCTGDTNPVHFDDAAARDAGFGSRISHGMLAGSELSRIFGTECPGPGTLFLRSELVFLAPIYPDAPHTLAIRFIASLPLDGFVPAVATVRDAAGALCLLAYCDLLKRATPPA